MSFQPTKTRPPQRILYEKIHIISGFFFGIISYLALGLKLWQPPEEIIPKVLILFAIPIVLISLYLTSIKRIFPQKIGDIVHICIAILILSNFAFFYGNGIGSYFVFLFFLLMVLSTFLLDTFIPFFVGILVSLIIVGEFFLTIDLTRISYIPLARTLLQVMAFLIVGWACSNLVKRTLSEQKAKQELRVAYEELQQLDKAKSEFISMASHQLRTPLSAIKGYVSMMIEGSYNHLSPKVKEKMKHVFVSNERLIRIVNDLLDISKIELGKMEVKKEKIQIEEIINSCYQELKPEAQKKNLKFIWQKPKPKLPQIEIDSLKIRQAILSLIDNAIKYTQKGEIEIKAQKTTSKIQISVRDTGEGLTEEEKKWIFESFTRGAAGISYWIEGAGLGLYVAKKYIELHKGEIWAESKGKGKGSIFFVELPIK